VVDNQALDLGALRERYAPNDGSFYYARSRVLATYEHARDDVLALLAEVERKDRALDEIRALAEEWSDGTAYGECSGANCGGCALGHCAASIHRVLSDLSEHQEEAK
jgi:hypothetical protein